MIIQCDKCQTKFRLDDSRIGPNGVKVRCTKCQNVFIVTPPPEEAQVEEVLSQENQSGRPPERPSSAPKTKDPQRSNLRFDFEKKDGEGPSPPGTVPEASSPEGRPKDFNLNGIDFSFGVDRSRKEAFETGLDGGGKKEERPDDAPSSVPLAPEPPHIPETAETKGAGAGEIDFNFDDDEKTGVASEAAPAAAAPPSPAAHSDEERGKEAAPQGPDEKVVPFSIGYTKEGMAVTEKAGVEKAGPEEIGTAEVPPARVSEEFSDVLFNSISKGANRPEDAEDVEYDEEKAEEAPTAKGKSGGLGLAIAIAVFILGGGLVYFTGVIDKLASMLAPPARTVKKTVEIESLNGLYAENRNFGRFFLLQAKLKNTSGASQEVKAVTGVLYNSAGEKLSARSVAPGRILSPEDVKNLSKEDILKPFKDASGGVIPPKGTVPVMVPFTDVPSGVAEFGLDVVR